MLPFSPKAACLGLMLALGLLSPGAQAAVGPQPVTVKELSLMLRGGYTGDDVLREIAGRPLLEPLDPAAEKSLVEAGADPRFINALKVSHRALSDDESAATRQRQAEIDQRDAATRQWELARLQPSTAAPGTVAAGASRGTSRPSRPNDAHYMENLLRGKLVSMQNGSLQPRANSSLEGKKLYALYFSQYMSRAGHEFTSDLIRFYQRMQGAHPEFEIILVSGDSSPFAMDNLMRREQMPWPAIAYDQIPQVRMIERFIEHAGASRLMIADNTGWVMADYRISVGNNNLPLILPDLEKLVANPTVLSSLSPPRTNTPGAGGSIGAGD